MRFMAFNGERLLAEANGWPFKEPENLISQPSMFFGTQASKRTWPRTLWALILGGGLEDWVDLSFGSSCSDPEESLPVWYSAELGKKKWSLGPSATLLRLWFESTAAFWRSQIKSDNSSCMPSMPVLSPSLRDFWEKTDRACSSSLETAALYWIGQCW